MATGRIFIGIDDTDFGESIGTGGVARELQLFLARELGADPLGVTRHQLFIHPDIPYTSHNSAACIEMRSDAPLDSIGELCRRFLGVLFHPGADPGLCIAPSGSESAATFDFARRAQVSVVQKAEAEDLANQAGYGLWGLGGTDGGVIGALCACALRMSGEDGRFLALKGIRKIPAEITVGGLLELTPIYLVRDPEGNALDRAIALDTRHGVRPDLVSGRAVLTVERRDGTFRTVGRKKGEDE